MRSKILMLMILFCLIYSAAYSIRDIIPVFYKIYIDGKEESDMLYLEIIVLKSGKEIEWYMNEVVLQKDELNKTHIISVRHSRYKDNYDIPLISDISWVPDKSFECKYHYFHEPINLKAIKKGKYDWEVYGSCRYKLRPDDPNDVEHFLEIRSVKEIKLKYKKIRMLNLYYK